MIPLSVKKAAVPRCPPPWKVKTLFVNDITDEQADALERAVNVAVRSVLLRWEGPLGSVCVDSESAAAVLQSALDDFVPAFFTAAHRVVGASSQWPRPGEAYETSHTCSPAQAAYR